MTEGRDYPSVIGHRPSVIPTRGSIDDRLHHGRLEIPVEIPAARLDQEDRDELLPGVDPEVRSERAVPAEAACGAERPGRDRVDHDLDGEAEAHPLRATGLAREQLPDVVRS